MTSRILILFIAALTCTASRAQQSAEATLTNENLLTFSEGAYPEVFTSDTLHVIGDLVYNSVTGEAYWCDMAQRGLRLTCPLQGGVDIDQNEGALRIGRFLSIDPLSSKYPWYTPYQFSGNSPVAAVDLEGLEEFVVVHWMKNGQLRQTTIIQVVNEQGVRYQDMALTDPNGNRMTSKKILHWIVNEENGTNSFKNSDELSTTEAKIHNQGRSTDRHGNTDEGLNAPNGENYQFGVQGTILRQNGFQAQIDKKLKLIVTLNPIQDDGAHGLDKIVENMTKNLTGGKDWRFQISGLSEDDAQYIRAAMQEAGLADRERANLDLAEEGNSPTKAAGVRLGKEVSKMRRVAGGKHLDIEQ